MRLRSNIGSLEIVRPLLGVWRSEIEQYVKEHRLKFREDAMNRDLGARRNRLRHEIVPWLEKQFGRNLRASLWRAASILAEEEALLEALVPNETAKGLTLEVEALRASPVALQRRTILSWLRGRGLREIGFEAVEKVRGLLAANGQIAKVNLPENRHARQRSGQIFLK